MVLSMLRNLIYYNPCLSRSQILPCPSRDKLPCLVLVRTLCPEPVPKSDLLSGSSTPLPSLVCCSRANHTARSQAFVASHVFPLGPELFRSYPIVPRLNNASVRSCLLQVSYLYPTMPPDRISPNYSVRPPATIATSSLLMPSPKLDCRSFGLWYSELRLRLPLH